MVQTIARKGLVGMKRRDLAALALFAALALLTQAVYLRHGFEQDTALPLVGVAMFLPPLTLLTATLFFLLRARELPRVTNEPAEACFAFSTGALTAGVAGVFLLLLGGALTVLGGETLSAVFAVLTAVCAFYTIFTLRAGGELESMMMLPPAFFSAVRLLLRYRELSYDPVRGHFYIELLAMAALAGCYLLLAAFAYRDGRPKLYAVTAALCVMLCAMTAAQGLGLAAALVYAGHGAVQLSFLAART